MRTIEPLYLVRRVKFDVFILKSTLFVFHGEPVKYYFTIYFYKPTSIRALSDTLKGEIATVGSHVFRLAVGVLPPLDVKGEIASCIRAFSSGEILLNIQRFI